MIDIEYDTTALSDALQRREITSVELVQESLDRAHRLNGELNSLITILDQEALAQAALADREFRGGKCRGPLHGIPFTAKDNLYTANILTTAGSRVLKGWVPSMTATVLERLRDAGAILIAKTNLSEFAAGPTNDNEEYGQARNPWNLNCIPGGSSGGSAGAVAAGIGVFSIGTDTGGSVRIPAALSGVVGIKPTFGLCSRHGLIPTAWSLDTVGILSRNAVDAAHVLEVIAGFDHADLMSVKSPAAKTATLDARNMSAIRVGLPDELLQDPCDPEVRQCFLAALKQLSELGVQVDTVSVPWTRHALAAVNIITWAECAAVHGSQFEEQANMYGRYLRDMILTGSAIPAPDYLLAQQVRSVIAQRSQELFRHLDFIATPTVAIGAPPIGFNIKDSTGFTALRQFTRLASCTGQPAISIPCGFTAQGLPVGLQLISGAFREGDLLRLAHIYERSRGWAMPIPPIMRGSDPRTSVGMGNR